MWEQSQSPRRGGSSLDQCELTSAGTSDIFVPSADLISMPTVTLGHSGSTLIHRASILLCLNRRTMCISARIVRFHGLTSVREANTVNGFRNTELRNGTRSTAASMEMKKKRLPNLKPRSRRRRNNYEQSAIYFM